MLLSFIFSGISLETLLESRGQYKPLGLIPLHSLAYHSVNMISSQTDIYPCHDTDLNINDSLGVIYPRSIMILLDSIQTEILHSHT